MSPVPASSLKPRVKHLLVDCGLYQERALKGRNWQFQVPPNSIDVVLLTHAHLDHSGRIPKLVKDGFRGKICCTDVTMKLAEIMFKDAGKLRGEDALYKKSSMKKKAGKVLTLKYHCTQ